MRLTGITWHGYELPFRHRYVTFGSRANSRFGLILFLYTSEGVFGVGEASPVGTSSADEILRTADVLERISPELLGCETGTLEDTISARDIPAALRFGLETALLDITGKARGCSVATLLGGRPASLPVNAIISAESAENAVAEALEAIAVGFNCLKLKVGSGKPDEDEALVSEVRRAVGQEVKLRLDANQAWDVGQAIESLRRLARYEIEYVEQPVPAADIGGLAEVRRAVPVPVAADESLGSLDNLRRILNAGAADIFILKAARLGGLRTTLAVANTALRAGDSVVVTTSLESSVGIAASAHLAAALPPATLSQGLATGLLFSDDLISPPLLPALGRLETPSAPGLGVKVNADMLRKHGINIMGSVGSLHQMVE
ncbi:MAG: o-succinylbenzoate synthase [Chloroflexi bacterium]|nr:o-succinylbenzoate synthase [Chloroflexota bacterium]